MINTVFYFEEFMFVNRSAICEQDRFFNLALSVRCHWRPGCHLVLQDQETGKTSDWI